MLLLLDLLLNVNSKIKVKTEKYVNFSRIQDDRRKDRKNICSLS